METRFKISDRWTDTPTLVQGVFKRTKKRWSLVSTADRGGWDYKTHFNDEPGHPTPEIAWDRWIAVERAGVARDQAALEERSQRLACVVKERG